MSSSAVIVTFKKRRRFRSARRIHSKNSPSQHRRRRLHNKRRRQKYRQGHTRRAGGRRKVRSVLPTDGAPLLSQRDLIVPAGFTSKIIQCSHQFSPLTAQVSVILIIVAFLSILLWHLFSESYHSSSSHILVFSPSCPIESQGRLILLYSAVCFNNAFAK